MAFVADHEPVRFNRPHLTLDQLKQLGDREIEYWEGSIEDPTDDHRQAARERGWMLIVVDRDNRHLMYRNGAHSHQPTAGVLIAALFNGDAQLQRFLLAQPTVTDAEVKDVVNRFEGLLRPTIELATRTRWAVELAELQQIENYSQRFPGATEVHGLRFSGSGDRRHPGAEDQRP